MKLMQKIGIGVLSVLATCCVFGGCESAKKEPPKSNGSIVIEFDKPTQNDEKLSGDPFDIAQTYYQGNVVKFATELTVNGVAVSVTPNVLYPSGKMVAATDARFDEVGLYAVVYKNANGEVVKNETFNVYKKTFVTTSDKSSVEIGKVKDYSKYDSDLQGAIVKLASGDELVYSEILDLSDNTKNDSLVSLQVLPAEDFGEVRTIVFTLTDVYDIDNTLTFTIARSNPYPEYVMLTVNATNQKPSGLESWYYDEGFTYDGAYYRFHSGDGYGTYLTYSMEGATNSPMQINMDYATKRVYFNGNICVDLDDPILFSNLWKGFSSDKCVFSMHAKDYARNEFNFLLTGLDGKTKFNKNFEDKDAPEITVDETEIFGVYAVAGKEFTIPEATAFDVVEGETQVSVSVYKNYGTVSQTKLYVEGKSFVPTTSGNYSIVYEAKDCSGNKEIKKYDVEAKAANVETLLLETTDSGDKNGIQGKTVVVSDYNVTRNNGSVRVEIKAIHNDAEYTVDTETLSFLPLHAGEYTIKYIVKDYTSVVETEYKVNVTSDGASSILQGTPIIPKYVIKNARHFTPKLSGYRFNAGKPVATEAEVYIAATPALDNAQLLSEDTFAYAGEVGQCYFGYKIDETVEWYESTVVDVGYGTDALRIKEYFTGTNGTTVTGSSENTYTDYVFTGTDDHASVEFVNAVQVFNFTVEIVIPARRSYNKLTFTFDDIDKTKNTAVTVTVDVLSNGSIKCYDEANNFCTLNRVVDNALVIGFSAETGIVTFTCGNTASLQLGEKVAFTNDKAYFSIASNSNETALRIASLNNQLISSQKKDLVFPQYTYSSQYGRFERYERVKIDGLQAADVLSPTVSVIMSAKTAEGKYVTALDGTLLNESADYTKDYEIELNEYTYYYVEYNVTDGRNKITYRYTFFVQDTQRPELVIGSHKTEYKVGNTVVVGDYVVTDDESKSEDCKVIITVTMPDNRTVTLQGNAFVANIAGKYKVYYYAQDEAGNVTLQSYVVTVS